MPIVSVILPTYNSAIYLGEAIESVLNQTFQDYEIIVVNDGSTDNTVEIASNFRPHCIWIDQENQGPSAARNKGLTRATGKFISFLDADDVFLPEKLELQVDFLENNPNIGLIYSDGYRCKQSSKGMEKSIPLSMSGDVIPIFNNNEVNIVHEFIKHNLFPINAGMVRHQCIKDIGGFDENLSACEDWDLWYRIAEKYPVAYIENKLVKYRETPGSNSSDLHRNYLEAVNVMKKIEYSHAFQSAPGKILCEFYYNRGVLSLALNNISSAKIFFKKSLSYEKKVTPRVALYLSRIFGTNAFLFYQIKRKLFGIRGLKSF